MAAFKRSLASDLNPAPLLFSAIANQAADTTSRPSAKRQKKAKRDQPSVKNQTVGEHSAFNYVVQPTLRHQEGYRESDEKQEHELSLSNYSTLPHVSWPDWSTSSLSSSSNVFSASGSPTPPRSLPRALIMVEVHDRCPISFRPESSNYGETDSYISFRRLPANATRYSQPSTDESGYTTYLGRWQKTPSISATLTEYDRQGLKFYLQCWARKRTLIEHNNIWITQILAISEKDPGTASALSAFGLCYLMDYFPAWGAYTRLAEQYKRAEETLVRQINHPETWRPNQEQAILATGIMLVSCDVTQWEDRQKKPVGECPRWLELARRLKLVLDQSDPSQLCHDTSNTQWPEYRLGFSNWLAMGLVASDALTPLPIGSPIEYEWLAHGRAEDQNKIHGSTGLSPGLLHAFSLITAYSAQISKYGSTPLNDDLPHEIKKKLEQIVQFSEETSKSTIEEIVSSYQSLKPEDVSRVQVIELSAAAWLVAAQVYSMCRLHRLLPNHPRVKLQLKNLRTIVSLLPTSGKFFTSQAPLFPIFLLGMLSQGVERNVAQKWFEDVAVRSKGRSSVPPLWTALNEKIWVWMDERMPLFEEAFLESSQLLHRQPWWEDLVAFILRSSGYLCMY